MNRKEIIETLSQDGSYVIHFLNERRSINIGEKNRNFDKAGNLESIRIWGEDIGDETIGIDQIHSVETK